MRDPRVPPIFRVEPFFALDRIVGDSVFITMTRIEFVKK